MKSLNQAILYSDSVSLSDYVFEGRTLSDTKKDIIKTLKISSLTKSNYKTGIMSGVQLVSVTTEPKKKYTCGDYSLCSLYDKNYDKVVIVPSFSYMNKNEYESKVINSLDNLSAIEGCSYQIINNENEYKELVNDKNARPQNHCFPQVLISVPKNGNEPELPSVPNQPNKIDKQSKETSNTGIKFWCTGAGDTRTDYIAYGAMDEYWKPNFARIQKRIGENKFTMYYTKISTKTFSSYKSLYNHLKKQWKNKYSDFSIVSEEELIEKSKDETYFIKEFWG